MLLLCPIVLEEMQCEKISYYVHLCQYVRSIAFQSLFIVSGIFVISTEKTRFDTCFFAYYTCYTMCYSHRTFLSQRYTVFIIYIHFVLPFVCDRTPYAFTLNNFAEVFT